MVIWVLLDNGSVGTCFNKELQRFIKHVPCETKKEKIIGSLDETTEMIENGLVDLVDQNESFYRIHTRFLPRVKMKQSTSEMTRMLIRKEVQINASSDDLIIWPDEKHGMTILGILGAEVCSLHSRETNPESIGMKCLYASPDLKLVELPWCADVKRKYVFIGSPGIDPARLDDNTNSKYPIISVPPTWKSLDTIPNDRKIDRTLYNICRRSIECWIEH